MGGAQRYPSISVSAAKLMGFATLYPSYGLVLAGIAALKFAPS
jgi:hypothetical protein